MKDTQCILVESVEVDEKSGVEIRDKIRARVLEVVFRDGGNLRLGQYRHYVGTRQPRVLVFGHGLLLQIFSTTKEAKFSRESGNRRKKFWIESGD